MSSLKILYAEDDPDIQMIASMALEDIGGFTLRICDNGSEVLGAYQEYQPDLILLDVMMPEIDGPMALAQLQERFANSLPPVVFITAKASTQEIERLMALGATAVITKPFNPMTLADDVQGIWSKNKNE